tara:strand:- start:182 stop:553 length:372 start_codon:yes stop_codon:yes gene_type:complete
LNLLSIVAILRLRRLRRVRGRIWRTALWVGSWRVRWRGTAAVVWLGLVELAGLLLRVWRVRRRGRAIALMLRRRCRVVRLRRVLALRLVVVGLGRILVLWRLIVVLLLLIASLMTTSTSTVII